MSTITRIGDDEAIKLRIEAVAESSAIMRIAKEVMDMDRQRVFARVQLQSQLKVHQDQYHKRIEVNRVALVA